jgi:hypothetical protein
LKPNTPRQQNREVRPRSQPQSRILFAYNVRKLSNLVYNLLVVAPASAED